MEPDSPQLSLIVQHLGFSNGSSSLRGLQAGARRIIEELITSGLWSWPLDVWTKGCEQSKRTFESLEPLIHQVKGRSVDGVVLTDHGRHTTEVEILSGDRDMEIYCSAPLGLSVPDGLLGYLTHVGIRLWEMIRKEATVGPVFSVRPINFDHPRPLPPRHSNIWLLGDAAYFISHSFHDGSPIGDPKGLEQLRSAKLPKDILRDFTEGLTVIRCRGPAEDAHAFSKQLVELEAWMSHVLQLPVHPDFRENGDQRIGILRKEVAPPFTFYDPALGIAYKTATETEARSLDPDTRRELTEALKVRTLVKGRKVRQVIVVFPTREAAIYNQNIVTGLGASGVAYVSDDGCLWNPKPAGNWIPVDKNKE